MTIRTLLWGGAFLSVLALAGCDSGKDANPQLQTKDAPKLEKKTPAGGPAAPGAPAAGNGGNAGPAPKPE